MANNRTGASASQATPTPTRPLATGRPRSIERQLRC